MTTTLALIGVLVAARASLFLVVAACLFLFENFAVLGRKILAVINIQALIVRATE
jgi:hypothetical protein